MNWGTIIEKLIANPAVKAVNRRAVERMVARQAGKTGKELKALQPTLGNLGKNMNAAVKEAFAEAQTAGFTGDEIAFRGELAKTLQAKHPKMDFSHLGGAKAGGKHGAESADDALYIGEERVGKVGKQVDDATYGTDPKHEVQDAAGNPVTAARVAPRYHKGDRAGYKIDPARLLAEGEAADPRLLRLSQEPLTAGEIPKTPGRLVAAEDRIRGVNPEGKPTPGVKPMTGRDAIEGLEYVGEDKGVVRRVAALMGKPVEEFDIDTVGRAGTRRGGLNFRPDAGMSRASQPGLDALAGVDDTEIRRRLFKLLVSKGAADDKLIGQLQTMSPGGAKRLLMKAFPAEFDELAASRTPATVMGTGAPGMKSPPRLVSPTRMIGKNEPASPSLGEVGPGTGAQAYIHPNDALDAAVMKGAEDAAPASARSPRKFSGDYARQTGSEDVLNTASGAKQRTMSFMPEDIPIERPSAGPSVAEALPAGPSVDDILSDPGFPHPGQQKLDDILAEARAGDFPYSITDPVVSREAAAGPLTYPGLRLPTRELRTEQPSAGPMGFGGAPMRDVKGVMDTPYGGRVRREFTAEGNPVAPISTKPFGRTGAVERPYYGVQGESIPGPEAAMLRPPRADDLGMTQARQAHENLARIQEIQQKLEAVDPALIDPVNLDRLLASLQQ